MKQIKNEDFSQTFSNNFQYGASNINFWVFMFLDPRLSALTLGPHFVGPQPLVPKILQD